jgi:hypothetical protein
MPELKVEKLSDLDFTIQCVSCGETKDVQMWPHRNKEGIESGLGRVAHGIANRVDRIKALGNGQVPFVEALAWAYLTGEFYD